jgi:hypothetical protein
VCVRARVLKSMFLTVPVALKKQYALAYIYKIVTIYIDMQGGLFDNDRNKLKRPSRPRLRAEVTNAVTLHRIIRCLTAVTQVFFNKHWRVALATDCF